jgi:hypothetical protein
MVWEFHLHLPILLCTFHSATMRTGKAKKKKTQESSGFQTSSTVCVVYIDAKAIGTGLALLLPCHCTH